MTKDTLRQTANLLSVLLALARQYSGYDFAFE